IDAVHYAPHGLIDVAALDCDFLACSTYKFFGPHMGVLYGKRAHLQRIRPYKVRPNTNATPNCWEWGTLNHECIAGIEACVEYIADVGRRVTETCGDSRVGEAALSDPEATRGSRMGPPSDARPLPNRRAAIEAGYAAIHEHEHALLKAMIDGLKTIPG